MWKFKNKIQVKMNNVMKNLNLCSMQGICSTVPKTSLIKVPLYKFCMLVFHFCLLAVSICHFVIFWRNICVFVFIVIKNITQLLYPFIWHFNLLCLFVMTHIVVNIMEFYATIIQVRDLASYKTRFNPPFFT